MLELVEICKKTRTRVLELSNRAKSAHAGSALSCVEILCGVFWLKYNEKSPISKFVLSKGHAAMALYAAAVEFNLAEPSLLENYLQDNSPFWGHPSVSKKFEFIHWITGSLGHGLPACVGFAYAEKYLVNKTQDINAVIAVISDGELNEGSNWEAIQFANHHKLSNLIVIIDCNKIQSFGRCDEVIDLEPLEAKFESFGFKTSRLDGHNVSIILSQIRNHLKGKHFSSLHHC
jgi:transketolase